MLNKTALEGKLNKSQSVRDRLETLKLAAEMNPDFKEPHIVGGYLRNVFLGYEPKDCDVVFKGIQFNQPGITEAVREAEKKLNIEPVEWDFENILATGLSDDLYENAIGRYSHHTDYLTLMVMDTRGKLYIGDIKTLEDMSTKTFDLRFSGVDIWANHRAKNRSYLSCLMGDLIRGLYLGKYLDLNHSSITRLLLNHFDDFMKELSKKDQQNRINFWLIKTNGDRSYRQILDKYKIKSLPTN